MVSRQETVGFEERDGVATNIQPLFVPVQLPSAPAIIFTAQANTRIDKLTVANVDVAGHVVSFFLVPTGGAPVTANQIVKNRPLQPGETWDVWPFMQQVLSNGWQICANADTAAVVNCFASGTVVS